MNRFIARVSPSAAAMIRSDHAAVVELFHRFDARAAPATRQALAARICLALEVHAQIEEEIFYPAMGSVDIGLVGKLIPEHDRMRSLIAALRATPADDARFDSALHELMREVMHHVADEETILLPQAERVLGERLGELGARMMKRRLALMAPHAGELARSGARTIPKTNLLVAAGMLLAAGWLFGHMRRHA
jgi:hemerythrin superfamily protein